MRRTFIANGTELGIEGNILITVYDNGATLAVKTPGWSSWGPPVMAQETT
jgi:hypothetical protein